jgi:large-conductance mechanosensitive channel
MRLILENQRSVSHFYAIIMVGLCGQTARNLKFESFKHKLHKNQMSYYDEYLSIFCTFAKLAIHFLIIFFRFFFFLDQHYVMTSHSKKKKKKKKIIILTIEPFEYQAGYILSS